MLERRLTIPSLVGGGIEVEVIVDPGEVGASLVAGTIRAHQDHTKPFVLGLATGHTQIPFYQALVCKHKEGELSFARVVTFNLDEFLGIPADDPRSFRFFMERHLFEHVDLPRENINFLDGTATDPDGECRRYQSAIKNAGGIDLQLLGLGANGHLAYNEPGSDVDSRIRAVTLSRETVAELADNLPGGGEPPTRALTMGIADILETRHCLLLATGGSKAEAVERALRGPAGPECPGSFLRQHPGKVTVLLDRAAASRL